MQSIAQETKPMTANPTYPFTLPPLAFEYDALEPHIDVATMKLHHDKHHMAYIDNLNTALKDYPNLHDQSVEQLLRGFQDLPEKIRMTVRNQGGGYANHQLFWKILRPVGIEGAGGKPNGKLAEAISKEFGSVDAMKKAFNEAGTKVFGSGWVFLVADPNSFKLKIHTTANQDSVLLEEDMSALIANDCWEHAYYLKYQNKRVDYLQAFWNVLAWDVIETRFEGILAGKSHL
jgi:superoxide dismutase, Fe-Mn family